MEKDVIGMLFAGFGGQGIMFMGKLLAEAGMISKKNVTWMPSYGAEVRGGTAYSMTKVSEKEIASPIVTNPDVLVVMNEPSLLKYEGMVKSQGTLIMNKSLINTKPTRKDIKILSIPMTEMAARLGSTRYANMIAVGTLLKRSKLFPLKIVSAALRQMLPDKEDLFLINKRAIEKGYQKG